MAHIVKAPNPVLAQKSIGVKVQSGKISKIDKSVLKIIEEMKKALLSAKDPIGVGLAAPQIGKSLRIFIAKPTLKSPISVFINPEILEQDLEILPIRKNKKTPVKLEGCLSLPNIWGEVKRYSKVKLSYVDQKGENHIKIFTGFMAIIIQHEIDHLEGGLFTKRVLEQQGTLYKSEKNEKNEDVFEEINI